MVHTVGVIGSRSLPSGFAPLVDQVVSMFLARGYSVASGGAIGADSFALSAVLHHGACSRGVIYSAWSSVTSFPSSVIPQVSQFITAGGQVVWGPATAGGSRQSVVSALLGRNDRLVTGSSVVVAFLHGQSRGSLYTVRHAISRGVPVIVFLCGGDASLPPDISRRCHIFNGKKVI